MANVPNSYSSASFVFASETTPAKAMQIHAAVTKFVPSAALRASPEQEWFYGHDFGFQYADLDSGEPVQAALKQMWNARYARIASLTRPSQTFYFSDPVSWVLIGLGTIGVGVGAGVGGEIGKDLWTGVKSGVTRLWRRLRQDDEQLSAFARLFGDLGLLHNHETGWNPVVLLQIPQSRLTFVLEPRLPKEAIRWAERLILRPKRNTVDVPLRWHRDRNRWLPVTSAILSEEALRKLRKDIDTLGREE